MVAHLSAPLSLEVSSSPVQGHGIVTFGGARRWSILGRGLRDVVVGSIAMYGISTLEFRNTVHFH